MIKADPRDPAKTNLLGCRIAMIAATKKVWSPISESIDIARDFVKPSIIETPIVAALATTAANLSFIRYLPPVKYSES